MAKDITCTCGHSWNKSTSSKKDMNVCHICGKDNTMKDGGWLDKFQPGGNVAVSDATRTKYTKNTGLKKGVDQPVLNMLDITLGAPQKQLVKMVTGKEQYPSEAMGIENPWGAFAIDAVADPTNLVGAGLLGKAAKASGKLSKASKIAKATELLPKKKNGGWLDKYNDGGPVQPNYNDASVSMSKDFVGDGYSNVGRNYSPAWGGQFAMGGSLPGSVGFTYARTIGPPAPSNGKYAKKTKASAQDGTTVPGEYELIQEPDDQINYDSENPAFDAASILIGQGLINSVPEANSPAIDININQRNLKAEHTFSHIPGFSVFTGEPTESYMLKRTVSPYTTDEDVRLNTQIPNRPQDVNFISNYAGARPDPSSEYPTSVPYQGEKHWNIDRFIIDPEFSASYADLENRDVNTDKTQQRRNTLADMYKYFMLQNKGDKDTAWKQANEFMTKEIDPRISGPMYNVLRNDETLTPIKGPSITDIVDINYLRDYNDLANEINLPEQKRSDKGREFIKNPASAKQAKDLAMDWLVNYKKMTPKQAESYYKKLPKNDKEYIKYINSKTKKDKPLYVPTDSNLYPDGGFQNGGEMKYYQEGLDFKPKTISKDGGWLSKYEEGGVIQDDMGQWAHPGEITEIGSNQITMQGVPYPVLGISDTGDTQMMYPNQEYEYIGNSVTEYPMAQNGSLTSLYAGKNPKTFGKNVAAAQSTGVNKVLPADPTKLTTQAQRDAQEAKERRNRINVANVVQPYMFSSPENLAVASSAIADKLRISDSPNWFDDNFFNPIPMIGHGASALGKVPLNIKQGNYGQAALDIAAPVAFGAAETLISPYLEKYITTPATKAIGEGLNFALRETTPYNNLNEIGRHILGGVPPERTLDRLVGDELRHARIINELGNKQSTGVSLEDRLAYAVREGLPQERIDKMFPGLQNQTPTPTPSTFGTPNPELARLRNQALTPEIENAAMSIPDDIAARGDMDEMMAWMRNNNAPIRSASDLDIDRLNVTNPPGLGGTRSMDELAARGDAGYEYVDPFDTEAFDPPYPELYEPINPATGTSAEYTRLSDEAIAANQTYDQQRAARLAQIADADAAEMAAQQQTLSDAGRDFANDYSEYLATRSMRSNRFPRTGGPRGNINHNAFIDLVRNTRFSVDDIANGAQHPSIPIDPMDRLYAQDILDPDRLIFTNPYERAERAYMDATNSYYEPINFNASPSPFNSKLNAQPESILDPSRMMMQGRRMGDPLPKATEDIIPPISEIPQVLSDKFINTFQEYPLYKGPVETNLGYLTMGSAGSKKEVANQIERAIQNASESGKVYTGSTSTSHNSYLTQLKQQFKMSKEAGNAYKPQFLGYKHMNSMGNLSGAGYSNKQVAAFLNSEIDQQIKRGVIPKNIQRPYVKNDQVMLPHYGLKKNEYGGTLEYFEQGGQLTKLDQLTNFTNYNTKQPGSWLDKYQ